MMDREEREWWEREIVSAAYNSSQEVGRRLLDLLDAAEAKYDDYVDRVAKALDGDQHNPNVHHGVAIVIDGLKAKLDVCERERDEARIAVEQTFAVNRALKGTNEILAADYETLEEDARALAPALRVAVEWLEGLQPAEGVRLRGGDAKAFHLLEVALHAGRQALARPGVRRLQEEK